MHKRHFVSTLIRLLLLMFAVHLAIGNASAQDKQACRPVTVTDAAGRQHTRYKTNCVTSADRKAVALRQKKALRLKAAQQGVVQQKSRRVK